MVKRSGELARSPMPARAEPMKRTELRRRTPLASVRVQPASVRPASPGEFSPAVKRLIDARDTHLGGGELLCAGCGRWLGGGYPKSRQHRVGRGAGGTSDPLLGSPANGITICGTGTFPPDACHPRCGRNDLDLKDRGFWIPRGNGPDYNPLYVPVDLWDGRRIWLARDGSYSLERPQAGAA